MTEHVYPVVAATVPMPQNAVAHDIFTWVGESFYTKTGVQTELPVRIEIEGTADGKIVRWLMEFQWSEAVPASRFEPNIPSDYTPLGQ